MKPFHLWKATFSVPICSSLRWSGAQSGRHAFRRSSGPWSLRDASRLAPPARIKLRFVPIAGRTVRRHSAVKVTHFDEVAQERRQAGIRPQRPRLVRNQGPHRERRSLLEECLPIRPGTIAEVGNRCLDVRVVRRTNSLSPIWIDEEPEAVRLPNKHDNDRRVRRRSFPVARPAVGQGTKPRRGGCDRFGGRIFHGRRLGNSFPSSRREQSAGSVNSTAEREPGRNS